jgi:protein-S-isoprenylcysteine O-methyltransferase Ste14
MTTETIFRIAFWILFAGVLVMRVFFSLKVRRSGERVMPDKQAIQQEGKGMFAVRVILFFIMIGWLVMYAINPSWMKSLSVPCPVWLRCLGFALGLASLGFWTWTQVALGKHWSPQLQLREKHHLVTSGPYARIRHPLYTAMFGYGASLALVTANIVFVFLAVIVFAGMFARVPREEEMMTKEFGDEYRQYMKKTGRFFPR